MGRDPGLHAGLCGVLPALCVLAPVAASAYPEGAPWSETQRGEKACTSCHFGKPPIADSPAIALDGAEGEIEAGQTYRLTLRFSPADAEDAKLAGVLVSFHTLGGAPGSIAAGEGLEVRETAVRSARASALEDGSASWSFDWTAPEAPGPVALHVAANAANDDASPFGDRQHFAAFALEVVPAGD